jgi:UDP-glucose 4-epimerase
MNKTVLITGGCGFIGSHICIELVQKNYRVVITDNFSNSSPDVLNKIKKLVGDDLYPLITFYNIDICTDKEALENVFKEHKINAVIHLAGYKAVKESIENPNKYYGNNLITTINLLDVMKKYECKRMIFSSSATVYGDKNSPYRETMVLNGKGITNPYGKTKWFQEIMLKDATIADPFFKVISLRYFNPIGNEPNGVLGEEFLNNPANLFPAILSAIHHKKPFHIFGNTYKENKIDGTPMRDFIHVSDLATAHVQTLDYLLDSRSKKNFDVFNVGLGVPVSVLQIVNTFIKSNDIQMNVLIKEKRHGDIPVYYCSNSKILKKINWKPKYTFEDACKHTWKYYQGLSKNQ